MIGIVDDPAKDAALRAWIEERCGAGIASVHRVSGGAFRTSSRVELAGPDGRPGCAFLKIDLGSAPKTPFDLRREHGLLARLDGRARAPRVIGWHEGATAMAMECLPGEAVYATIQDDAHRARIERSFVDALAECHAVDIASLALDHLPAGLSIGQAIAQELAMWEALLDEGVADPDPLTLFAFRWLHQRLPKDDRPAVLVQGDAGAGNFLFDDERVTGVVDWEMTHLGHPLEDIGCVLARSLVQPMASAEHLLALYNAASGVAWTRDELLYVTVLVMARFSVPIALALESRHTGLDYGLTNSYFRLSQISLVRLIALAENVALDEAVPAYGARPPIDFEFDYLRDVLGRIVRPAVDDPYVGYRLDGAIGLIGYLGAALGTEAPAAREDRDVMRKRYADQIAARDIGPTLQAFLSDALWREKLMRDMLGPLHGRRVDL
ncbi:Predicted kinase, aminoglycoside phosphotransferase (APT) family [Sphingomonas laterariae]|uniref:Predicted kinase, aminoglycoside phosphotransferase (APT) family n=1 Tax=Edaphosphingomonas laterariae TaxID=861865 RepID=A0A239C678_9SPHN|nr:phosphotransferase family protein [Sphingomonas laterariae]SNS15747.1 Predicted kinase, aminoglycoside phosphotransferase (APT) family [Sphingomonas laterariae]